MSEQKLLVGTGKGLVVYEKKDQTWKISAVHFQGLPASYVYEDEITDTWWVAINHRHWGPKLHYSTNQGKDWQTISAPRYPSDTEVKPGKRASLKKIWAMHHAGPEKPGALWIGTEPGGLFYRPGANQPFELVKGLWNHPSRKDENQWFGAGRDYPFIHSIVVDPRDSRHVYIAVSCAGVFETRDGGHTWHPCNKGLIAAYLPNPQVEVGHDPHLLLACEANPSILWQQNHCGIFRSTDGGRQWDNITGKDGFPDYGFALAINHQDPEMAWVIPAVSDEIRTAKDLALCVCRTKDGGQTWEELRNGLPQTNCFDIVFRHSMAISGPSLAFGSTTGNLYISSDYGDHWELLSSHLARVDCLVFTSEK
jgi:hypothetical protein